MPAGPGGPGERGGADVAAPTSVRQLARSRAEVAHLHQAMRHRGVIEQAKGVLMAWFGVDADHAFGLLVGHSQRSNRKLAASAATVLAYARTRAPDGEPAELYDALEEVAARSEERVADHLADARIAAAPDLVGLLDEVAAATDDPPDALLVGAVEPSGALRLLATRGFSAHVLEGWERVPPHAGVPLSHTATTGEPFFAADRTAVTDRFPLVDGLEREHDAMVTLPVALAGRLLGVLGLVWRGRREFTPPARQRLGEVADGAALALADHLAGRGLLDGHLEALAVEPAQTRWFHAVMDEVPAPVLLLEPEVTDDTLVELHLVHANPAAADHLGDLVAAAGPLGSRLTQRAPAIERHPLWPAAAAALQDGGTRRLGTVPAPAGEASGADGPPLEDLRCLRVGSLLCVTWRAAPVAPRVRSST